MLCSARELGLGDDHTGILVLPADSPLGVPYGDVTGLRDDVVIDVDVTRNRPDCWSYVGVARDLAAKLGVAFTPPTPPAPAVHDGDAPRTTVEIVDGDRCGRFTSTVLSGVAIGPSAPWMAERLTAAGMRPINNVVDVSNYVMLELGQPNHAYDLATLGGHGFRIRTARDGEEIVTLDDVTRRLAPTDLLICDALDVPIGIGGIMGGADTEISDDHDRRRPGGRLVRTRRHRPAASPGSACGRRRRRATSAASTGGRSTRRSPASSSCSPRRAPASRSRPGPSTPGARRCRRANAPAMSASARSTASSGRR